MLEGIVGYPAALHRRIAHPVTWIGAALSFFERLWNRPDTSASLRKFLGIATLMLVGAAAGVMGLIVERGLPAIWWGTIILALIATLGLAQRSLYDHVNAVRQHLEARDIESARAAVAGIVGRDVATLDDSGIAAAAIESLAESFNDGVVAPVFWFVVGGVPGLFIYKAVNTADSIIGHMEPRWKDFGWAAARTDDVVNWRPARIAGLLIVIVGWGGLRTMLADAHKHASPTRVGLKPPWPARCKSAWAAPRLMTALFTSGQNSAMARRPRPFICAKVCAFTLLRVALCT